MKKQDYLNYMKYMDYQTQIQKKISDLKEYIRVEGSKPGADMDFLKEVSAAEQEAIENLNKEYENWLGGLNDTEFLGIETAKSVKSKISDILSGKKPLEEDKELLRNYLQYEIESKDEAEVSDMPGARLQEERGLLDQNESRNLRYLEESNPDLAFRIVDDEIQYKPKKSIGDSNVKWEQIDPPASYYTSGFFDPKKGLPGMAKEFAYDTRDILSEGLKGSVTSAGAGVGKTIGAAVGSRLGPMGSRLGSILGGLAGGTITSGGSEYLHQKGKERIGMLHGGEGELAERAAMGSIEGLLPSPGATKLGAGLIKRMSTGPLREGALSALDMAQINKIRDPLTAGVEWLLRKGSQWFGGIPNESLQRYAAMYSKLKTKEAAGTLDEWERKQMNDLQVKLGDITSSFGDYTHGKTLEALEDAPNVDISGTFDVLDSQIQSLKEAARVTGIEKYEKEALGLEKEFLELFPADRDTYKDFSAQGAYLVQKRLDDKISTWDRQTQGDDFVWKNMRTMLNKNLPGEVRERLSDYSHFIDIKNNLRESGLIKPFTKSTDPTIKGKPKTDDFIGTVNLDSAKIKEKAIQNLNTAMEYGDEKGLSLVTSNAIENALKKINVQRTRGALDKILEYQDYLRKQGADIPLGPLRDVEQQYKELLTSKEWMGPRVDVQGRAKLRNLMSSFPTSYAGYHGARAMGLDFPLAVGAGGLAGVATSLGLSGAGHKAGVGASKTLQKYFTPPDVGGFIPSFEGGAGEIAKRLGAQTITGAGRHIGGGAARREAVRGMVDPSEYQEFLEDQANKINEAAQQNSIYNNLFYNQQGAK